MQRSCIEIDLDDWELLPDNKNYLLLKEFIVDMDHFICPPRPLLEEKDNSRSRPPTVVKEFKDIGVVRPPGISPDHHVHDVVSQVSFKKLKEANEFVVDMMLDSPWSNSRGAIMPPLVEAEQIQFSEDEEADEIDESILMEVSSFEDEEIEKEKKRSRIRSWKFAFVGAFCSVGAAAAATICVFVFGGRQQQKQRIQFSIYADDKVL